jgi:hypothetical protein
LFLCCERGVYGVVDKKRYLLRGMEADKTRLGILAKLEA